LEATKNAEGPIAIRYPRGGEDIPFDYYKSDFTVFKNDGDIAVVSYGIISSNVLKAQNGLAKLGTKVDFIKLNKIFPISEELIKLLGAYRKVYIFEEGIRKGGVGEHIASRLNNPTKIIALNEGFIPSMPRAEALKENMLDTKSIIRIIESEN
jgi:1-deoxy-D-xylulose-5-phosphate synthase